MYLNLRVVWHYSIEGPEHDGDYYDIEVFKDDDQIPIQSYGDYYHDNGSSKLEGFLDGLRYMGATVDVTREDIADRDF